MMELSKMWALSLSGVDSEATSFALGMGNMVWPLIKPIITNVYAMKLLYLKIKNLLFHEILGDQVSPANLVISVLKDGS